MTNVDRRDEIEAELEALDSREEEIEHLLHEFAPEPAPEASASGVREYTSEAARKRSAWDELVAEQISLISRRHALYSEFSALTTTEVRKNG
jgi:hypothetical protein